MNDKMDLTYIPITGRGVDELEARKESDDGPTESEVTAQARQHFKKYGPPDWSPEVLRRAQEMCREKPRNRS